MKTDTKPQKQQTPPKRGLRALTGTPGWAMISTRLPIGCDLTTNLPRLQLARSRGRVTVARRSASGYHGIESATASGAVLSIAPDSNKMPMPMHVGTGKHPIDPRRSFPVIGMLCLDHRTKKHLKERKGKALKALGFSILRSAP